LIGIVAFKVCYSHRQILKYILSLSWLGDLAHMYVL
jgi:hypothetical protein